MFDLGAFELLIIFSVAVIVIGPKDLPRLAIISLAIRDLHHDFVSVLLVQSGVKPQDCGPVFSVRPAHLDCVGHADTLFAALPSG
jgi:hypothetical protein